VVCSRQVANDSRHDLSNICKWWQRNRLHHFLCQLSSSFLACNSRLRSAIRRHHPPQRAVLSQICCFGEHKVVLFQILWTVLSHVMRGRPSCLLQSVGGEANRILLASALSSMRIICPNRISRCDWIIAVSIFRQLSAQFKQQCLHQCQQTLNDTHKCCQDYFKSVFLQCVPKNVVQQTHSDNFVKS